MLTRDEIIQKISHGKQGSGGVQKVHVQECDQRKPELHSNTADQVSHVGFGSKERVSRSIAYLHFVHK